MQSHSTTVHSTTVPQYSTVPQYTVHDMTQYSIAMCDDDDDVYVVVCVSINMFACLYIIMPMMA